MSDDNGFDVEELYEAHKLSTGSVEEDDLNKTPRNKYSLANSLVNNAKERDFGDDEPMTAKDLLDYFTAMNLKTNEICSVLTVNNNRFGNMTRTCPHGRDMSYEYISPTLEIFVRLIKAYPEYAPWKKVTIQDVADATGFDIVTLAYVCGSSETAGERWDKDSSKTTPLVNVLLKLIYNMAISGVDQVVFREVADKVMTTRNNFETTRLLNDNSWNCIQDQTLRKVRKIFRNGLNDLHLDGNKSKLQNTVTTAMMKELALKGEDEISAELDSLRKRSGLKGIELDQSIHTIRLCLLWLRTRDYYQKSFVTHSRQKKETEDMPKARLDAYIKSKGDGLITDDKLNEIRDELSKINQQLENHVSTTLNLWQ